MNSYDKTSARLQDALKLAEAPVAVSFMDQLPEGMPSFTGSVPGGCRFWQEASARTFATSTADHELCSIGVHTHRLASPSPTAQAELGEALKAMVSLQYVREEDVAKIPVMNKEHRYVVYGPLAEAAHEPDVVLFFAHSQQGLVVTEAVQQLEPDAPPAMGRPACAIIPQVANSGSAALSLGCCGARAYLDVLTDDTALWALPGSKIDAYVAQIEVFARANAQLAQFHQLRREDVEAGRQPSVAQSLARL